MRYLQNKSGTIEYLHGTTFDFSYIHIFLKNSKLFYQHLNYFIVITFQIKLIQQFTKLIINVKRIYIETRNFKISKTTEKNNINISKNALQNVRK